MDNLKIYGRFTIQNLTTGEVRNSDNTIMNVGKSMMAQWMLNDVTAGSAFDFLAIGTGSDTILAADTTLGAEYLRIPGSGIQTTTTTSSDTAMISGTFLIDDTKILNEVGIFNQSGLDLGSMFARSAYANLTVGSRDNVTATYSVTFA